VRLAESGRTDKQGALGLADEPAGGQFVNVLLGDLGVIVPVEVFQGLHFQEAGGAAAGREPALLPQVEFVLENEGQKLGMGEPAGGGFLQAHPEGGRQAGKPELFERQFELRVVHSGKGIW